MKKYMLSALLVLVCICNAFSQTVFTYLADFKDVPYYGFADSAGNTLTGGKYNLIMQPKEGKCRVWAGQTSSSDYTNIVYGFCLTNGTELVPPQFAKAEDFSEGLAEVGEGSLYKGYHYGFINTKGIMQIPATYQDAKSFSQGLAPVSIGDKKWQYIDKNGAVKIAGPFLDADVFSEGLAGVSIPYDLGSGVMSFHKGYIDLNGKMVIQPQYNFVMPFKNGVAVASVSESTPAGYKSYQVLIDKGGHRLTKDEFVSISNWQRDGLYAVKISGSMGLGGDNDLWGVIDAKGVLQGARFNYEPYFSEGLAPFSKDGLYGYMDKKGTVVIQPTYKNALSFSEGMAAVLSAKTNSWGFINKKNEVVIQPQYVTAVSFSDGLAIVQTGRSAYDKDNLIGAIDKLGKVIIPFEKRTLGNFIKERSLAEKNYISYYQYANGTTSLSCDAATMQNARFAYQALNRNNIQGALDVLNKESDKHCPMIDYWKGYILMLVTVPLRDTANGAALIEQAANKGFPQAMYSIGFVYQNGLGGKKDEVLAKQWLLKAAQVGVPTAYTLLGVNEDKVNPSQAATYYQKAVDLGEPIAMYNLALLYRDGRGVTKNESIFNDLLIRASKQYEPARQLLFEKQKVK